MKATRWKSGARCAPSWQAAAIASHRPRIDWEDYLWNGAHARCIAKNDTQAIEWLRSSYLAEAERWMRVQRDLSRQVWGRDIKHVALLHLGSFSSHILPDLFKLLEREGYRIVTLEEAQSDPIYDVGPGRGGPTRRHTHRTHDAVEGHLLAARPRADKPREKLRSICN